MFPNFSYYQNPYSSNLSSLSVSLSGIVIYANTEAYGYPNPDLANESLMFCKLGLKILVKVPSEI